MQDDRYAVAQALIDQARAAGMTVKSYFGRLRVTGRVARADIQDAIADALFDHKDAVLELLAGGHHDEPYERVTFSDGELRRLAFVKWRLAGLPASER